MWKQFPIVLDESCASIFRFTLKMEAVDYMVSNQEDGILQYYLQLFVFLSAGDWFSWYCHSYIHCILCVSAFAFLWICL
jgi:hypothetical protein